MMFVFRRFCEINTRYFAAGDTSVVVYASGGVKIVEIGRFENRCIRGRIPGKRRCSSPWFQKKMAEEDISTEVE